MIPVFIVFISVFVVITFMIYVRLTTEAFVSDVCMERRVVIVTGANSGIGFYTARNLARRGARVILACRDPVRGHASRNTIISDSPEACVEFRQLDLSSLKSVRRFAKQIIETENALHVLVNNAGVCGLSGYTEDGIVETLQVNYYGHFLLTLLLLPLLRKSQPSRIINLSSIAHFIGSFHPDRQSRWPLQNLADYCNSKLYMLLFTKELARRLEGTRVVTNAVHPGAILTRITSKSSILWQLLFWLCCQLYGRTAEQGAHTVEYLAAADECASVSGQYFVDCANRISSWRANSDTARKLWIFSEKLVGYQK